MLKELPLNAPLPSDVFQKSSIGIVQYMNYPVFSWPWLRGRALLFGAIALTLSVIGTANVYLPTHSLRLGALWFAHASVYWLSVMLLGPLMATFVRHSKRSSLLERIGIVASIAIGVLIAYMLGRWVQRFYAENVQPILLTKGFITQEALAVGKYKSVGLVNDIIQILLFALLGGGVALRAYFSQHRRWWSWHQGQELSAIKLQRDSANRSLTILQAQVEPHFLYNTLASVRSLVRSDPARAEATIDALVDHLRATLPKFRESGEAISTLGEQIAICLSYLEVMRIRMGDRLSYRVDLPAELRDVRFPALILISLVENAIKHGVEPKPGNCSLSITAMSLDHGERLEVSVVDDGAGLREGPSKGMGLANIRAQLSMQYGERASLSLANRQTGGVIATIQIPVERNQ